jgi:hypothetical protein
MAKWIGDYQEIPGQEILSHSKLLNMRIVIKHESLLLAGDCPLPGLDERQLTRKLPLKLDESAATGDPI